MKILYVEDDQTLAEEVKHRFADAGLELEYETSGTAGLNRALNDEYSLIILDLMLPGSNGLDICRGVKSSRPHIPVIMLTSRSEEIDKVLGLELGADDYVAKPFSVPELVARVRGQLRRLELYQSQARSKKSNGVCDNKLKIGELTLDTIGRTLLKNGEEVPLTAKEFDVLSVFMQDPGKVFTRMELLRTVWCVEVEGYEEAVTSLLRRLRAKIEDDQARPKYIRTVRGVGYCLGSRTTPGDINEVDEE